MNADHRSRLRLFCVYPALSVVPFLILGCGKPNPANIILRKENQSLQDELEQLRRAHEADQASIRSLERSATTMPILPQERIEQLFTVHGIRLKRLTGGADLDPARAGDEGIKVYLEPFDKAGDSLKAAGSIIVEAFDLAASEEVRIARCEIELEEARKKWLGSAMLYEYVVSCPFERPPAHSRITVKVTFIDGLTQRQFTAQKVVNISLPSPADTAAAK